MERVFIQQVIATPAHASMRMRAYFVRQRAYIRLVYSMGLRRAAHVITGTDHARHDLTKLLKVPDRKITRIYHGRDDAFARATPVPRSERTYTLMLGGDVFQKNADGAIKAWSLVPPEVRQRHPLRVIGFAGKDDSPLLKTMRDCRLTNEVTIEGWLSSEDVVSRFQYAALFLFLSHHEGFGFPIVHAMTAGTPVVHSSTSCLPEVAGGAGLACKPSDARAIAAAITKVLTDDVEWGLCQRRGLARSGQFNWTESAAAHAQVFSRVVRPKTQGRTP
jgi:alpha-1,3-rhamnosyl/mannosyltransferase